MKRIGARVYIVLLPLAMLAIFIYWILLPRLHCGQATELLSPLLATIGQELNHRRPQDAFFIVGRIVSGECKIEDPSETRKFLSLLAKFMQTAVPKDGYRMLYLAKNASPEIERTIIDGLKPNDKYTEKLHLVDLLDIPRLDAKTDRTIIDGINSIFHDGDDQSDDNLRLILKTSDNKTDYLLGQDTTMAGADSIDDNFVLVGSNGNRLVKVADVNLKAIEQDALGPTQYSVAIDESGRTMGLLRTVWDTRSLPLNIDDNTICPFQFEFFSIEKFGFSRRFKAFGSSKCKEDGPLSGIEARYVNTALSRDLIPMIQAALGELPDFSVLVNFSRRNDADLALVKALTNQKITGRGSLLALADQIINTEIGKSRTPPSSIDEKGEAIGLSLVGLNSESFNRVTSNFSFAFAFAGDARLYRSMDCDSTAVSDALKQIDTLDESMKNSTREANIDFKNVQYKEVVLTQQLTPQDVHVPREIYPYVYLAVLPYQLNAPAVILSIDDLMINQDQRKRLPLITMPDTVPLFNGQIWLNVQKYMYAKGIIKAKLAKTKIKVLEQERPILLRKADALFNNCTSNLYRITN